MLGDMTAMPTTWAILVPTLGERRRLFERLMAGLLPQAEPYGDRVQIRAWHNNGQPSLPEIRQRMLEQAAADGIGYVSFVDDDDLVAPDYVAEIVTALADRPDYVGFQVQCYSDGRPTAIAHHSLKHDGWVNLPDRFLRDISHINPMRTELATTADFRVARAGAPEDRAWVAQLRRSGVLKTETVVDRILYHYLYSTSRVRGEGSRWKNPRRIHRPVTGQSVIEHPNFSWSHRGL
jgi:hypothetical protein